MSRRIKFRAQCFYCKRWFEKGQAYLQRADGKWLCQCDDCYHVRRRAP